MPVPIKPLPRRFKLTREDGITTIKVGGAPNFMPYLMSFLVVGTLAATEMTSEQVNFKILAMGGVAAAALAFSVATLLSPPHLIISNTELAVAKNPKSRNPKFLIPMAEVAKVWDEDSDAEGTLSYIWVENVSGARTRLPVPLRGVEETSYLIAQIERARAEASKQKGGSPSVS